MIHQGGKFDAVLNVLLQDIQHFHQFIRRKLWIKQMIGHFHNDASLQQLDINCEPECNHVTVHKHPLFTLWKMRIAFILAESLPSSLNWCFPSKSSSGISSSSV